MSPDRQWLWQTRGLLGGIGLIETLDAEDTIAPSKAIAELEQAREHIEQLLRRQRQKREPCPR